MGGEGGVTGPLNPPQKREVCTDKFCVVSLQFDTLHTRGSSHGGSRITRRAYNQSIYVHMMSEAFKLWDEIEKESDTQLYW